MRPHVIATTLAIAAPVAGLAGPVGVAAAILTHRVHWRRASSLVVLTTLLIGCGSLVVSAPPVVPRSFDPEPTLWTVSTRECEPTGITGVLHSDPADPRVAWLVTPDERRVEVVWPTGYRARFVWVGGMLALEVFDDKARLFATTTDVFTRTCSTGRPDVVLLMPDLE
jgi:hypothetical protein